MTRKDNHTAPAYADDQPVAVPADDQPVKYVDAATSEARALAALIDAFDLPKAASHLDYNRRMDIHKLAIRLRRLAEQLPASGALRRHIDAAYSALVAANEQVFKAYNDLSVAVALTDTNVNDLI